MSKKEAQEQYKVEAKNLLDRWFYESDLDAEELSKDGESARRSTETQSNDEAQSELGGAVDGLTHRVDRLRLLGNGVVPQTAELAWRTLWRKMSDG